MKIICRYLSLCVLILSTQLILGGCNSSEDDKTLLDDPGSSINPPGMPTDLRGVVYSSTSIELEWNAATDDGTVVEYRVSRDGSLVATQTSLRFFENNLVAGSTHTYSVLAVDDEGNLSETAVIDMTTLDDGPVVSEANYLEHNLMWSTTISNIDIDVYATDEDPLINYAVPFRRTFDARFVVQGPQTGDELLTVAIELETNDPTDLNYQTGLLTVTAKDGSSMRMTADNSDSEAFQLSLSQADSSTALTIPWSAAYRLKCFHAPTFDARFAACE